MGDKRKMTDKEKELQAEAIGYYRKRIAELEKENAELKEKCQDRCDECWEEHIKLTKAKRALRKVIDYLGQFCSDYPDCVIEAEKILKECK